MKNRRHALRCLFGSAAALTLPACGAPGWAELLIGTTLDADACADLAARFVAALTDRPAPRIGWVRVSPDRDLALERLAASGRPLDLIVGGDAPVFERLACAGRLALPPERAVAAEAPDPSWRVLREVQVGLAIRPDVLQERALELDPAAPVPAFFALLTRPVMAGLVALDDPRRDADTLALAAARLAGGPSWAAAYADLVRLAAQSAPAGARPGAALARLARGELAVAPARRPSGTRGGLDFKPVPADGPVEGIAVLADAPHAELARRFVEILAAPAVPRPRPAADAATRDLLATLLGAALVDAQPELVAARAAIETVADPARAQALDAFLVEAPPWPPASVQRLAARGRGDLIEALAAQIAPDLERRYWLLQNWDDAPARIDGARLGQLAGAVDGTLLAEPRLRTWLEAEWRAWTRQRGRRVARQARLDAAPTPATSPTGPPPGSATGSPPA